MDGAWFEWSDWTACSLTCGNGGTKNRSRECDGPHHSGDDCGGHAFEQMECFVIDCPGVLIAVYSNLQLIVY